MRGAVTQKDIARRLGVSQALVSRVLTGTSERVGVAPETAERIRRAAAACHYRPSAAALTLKGGPTRILGVVVKRFDDPFLGYMIGALQQLAARDGYALVLAGWDAAQDQAADLVLLRRFRPDGLILCGSDFTPGAAEHALAAGRPVAQLGAGAAAPGVRQVLFDQRAGLEALVRLLAGLGHVRFGFVGDDSPANRRRAALMRELLPGGRRKTVAFVEVAQRAEGPELAAVKALCADPERRPTALFAADDELAQAVLRALHECGLRVPQDVSLAGMDDIPMARLMIPSLTTVRQPVEAMVARAFRAVTGGEWAGGPDVLPPALVVRESCAPPASGGRGERGRRRGAGNTGRGAA